ncbi:TetR/AcrR family transcriptional regulator [Phenylobacterium deserti]|uniref:TetR/AcrR family transcriptional regulator n=1 Tax=Phenylobacterium deserti TaxID=1914756 RepID=A0A328ATX8_9CAUL|nr:TetR/AcrR family transcriptional regulator [Phenylobacterium deserti]RAK58019.1 TetR/AcrR family transcriptional regulator [Phenylobacterium deserti]
MTDPLLHEPAVTEEAEAATKAAVFNAAERLFALHGFQNVSVRDITAEAGVNLASVNYHFGSKDALLFEIFRRRAAELNRERARLLHEATKSGTPSLRGVLEALFAPPLRWTHPANERRISIQFLIRARSEGTAEMREALQHDVSHLERFASALMAACPHMPRETVYWRLHFCLGMVHNNRFAEFDRLHHLSGGLTQESDVDGLLQQMLDFAEAGFRA